MFSYVATFTNGSSQRGWRASWGEMMVEIRLLEQADNLSTLEYGPGVAL